MPDDPWLTARMHDYAALRRAEAELLPAVAEAVAAFLTEVAGALLGSAALTAAAGDGDGPRPDLDRFPPDSAWSRLVERYITPVGRRIFRSSYRTLAPTDTEAFSSRVSRYASALPGRLAGFPGRVWERVRAAVSDGLARGRSPQELRARVEEELQPGNFTGQVNTITRTEVHTSFSEGAYAAARTEENRTGQPWSKTWISTRDDRVRATHRSADGQVRALDEPFSVGGFPLQFPGDPLGPPQETFNCRCSARYRPPNDASPTASLENS